MKVKSKLNSNIQIPILIGIIILVNVAFRSEKIFGKTILISLPGLIILGYTLYLYWKTILAKANSSFFVHIKKNKILPIISFIFFGFLFLVQFLIFLFQEDNGYNVNYFIMNTTMFLSLVSLSFYYLVFNKLFVNENSLFYRGELSNKNYNFEYDGKTLVLKSKNKYSYFKIVRFFDDDENIAKIVEITKTQKKE